MQSRRTQFTSESVAMGHPDKACDQVSDAILDAVLAADPMARVACEVLLTSGLGVIAGEVTSSAVVDFETVARDTLHGIGYTAENGFDAANAEIRVAIQEQSPDIARGVEQHAEMGAGDQGMMFGYAIADTPELMPLPITLAQGLVARQAAVRVSGEVPHLRPDAKSQVTVEYRDAEPVRISSVVLSTQHGPQWDERQGALRDAVTAHVLRPALGEWWDDSIEIHVNPTGRFVRGGPEGDTGLTGRKIIVDTYGGWGRHGGGAFSGKDPSKVDRSAAYMARYIAKNVVAAGLAHECEVRLGYAIGVPDPTMLTIDCRGTAADGIPEAAIEDGVRAVFGRLTPAGIIDLLDLRRPIYLPTAVHGHFGRVPDQPAGYFTWERVDRAPLLAAAVGATVGA
ncbi:MAG TPA: methionine adenosyltransferase [Acidimicrobiia bacterium]|nr:methionine adenosyltransferase [Acidimicrobiia bacterium]